LLSGLLGGADPADSPAAATSVLPTLTPVDLPATSTVAVDSPAAASTVSTHVIDLVGKTLNLNRQQQLAAYLEDLA